MSYNLPFKVCNLGCFRVFTVAQLFVVVQLLNQFQLFATPWTAFSQSLLRLMSIELMMPSNHLILCCPLLILPSIFPSIRVFSNELGLRIRWPKYWNFSFSISPSSEDYGLILEPHSGWGSIAKFWPLRRLGKFWVETPSFVDLALSS